jgi:hypothetical protein
LNTIYVSAFGSTFVTTNHGATWTLENLPVTGTVADIQVDPSNAQVAYAVVRQCSTPRQPLHLVRGPTTTIKTNAEGPPSR